MLFRNPGGGTAGVEVTATQTGHQKRLLAVKFQRDPRRGLFLYAKEVSTPWTKHV
jgi:hypothetical protein